MGFSKFQIELSCCDNFDSKFLVDLGFVLRACMILDAVQAHHIIYI